MCVFVEIEVPDHPRQQAGQLSKELAKHGLLVISAQRQAKSEKGSRFLMGPADQPCACGLGGDRVDETGDKLEFDHSHIGEIEATLRFLLSRANAAGLRIRAYYVGAMHDRVPPLTECKATLDELIDKIRHDQLGGNVRYYIRG